MTAAFIAKAIIALVLATSICGVVWWGALAALAMWRSGYAHHFEVFGFVASLLVSLAISVMVLVECVRRLVA